MAALKVNPPVVEVEAELGVVDGEGELLPVLLEPVCVPVWEADPPDDVDGIGVGVLDGAYALPSGFTSNGWLMA